jgi:hypothetical protein
MLRSSTADQGVGAWERAPSTKKGGWWRHAVDVPVIVRLYARTRARRQIAPWRGRTYRVLGL